MSTFDGLRRVFRIAGVRRDVKTDLEEELEFHFQMTMDELVAGGMSKFAARAEANRRFGDLSKYKKELQRTDRRRVTQARWAEAFHIAQQNIGYALRGMRHAPGFTAAVVATLALGIGANATMFGIVDRLLLQPPAHVKDPGRVRRISSHGHWSNGRPFNLTNLAYLDFIDWQAAESFESVAAYSLRETTLGLGAEMRRVSVGFASGDFFSLLGVQPALGRLSQPEDDRPGAPPVAVLSYGFWQREFGGDPGVLGRVVDGGRQSYTVIGVAPQGFIGIDLEATDVWMPLNSTFVEFGYEERRERRWYYWLNIVARLRPGVDVAAAETEATLLHRAGRRELIERGFDPEVAVTLSPIQTERGPSASQESLVARWLAGVSLVVLLIACANVANLLLARATRRRKEIAIRLALGISRRRLIGELLTDSMVLAGFGGVVALLIAAWGGGLVRTALLPGVAWVGSSVPSRVLAFTAVLTLLTGLAAGLVPAIQASRPSLSNDLKEGMREGRARRSGTRMTLLVAQAALSVVLLVGAGLVVRSLQRVKAIDLGMVPEGVLMAEVELQPAERSDDEVLHIYQRVLDRLKALPIVEEGSASGGIPFTSGAIADLFVPGLDSLPASSQPGPWIDAVWPGYFATMGIPITRGRGFTEADVAGAMRVAVVNEAMANGLWGTDDPLGKCLRIDSRDSPCTTVVGVTANRRYHNIMRAEWTYFVPLAQYFELGIGALFVRGRGDSEPLAAAVRRELMASDPNIRYAVVRPLQDVIDPKLHHFRLGATMFTIFGALALVVAALGLFAMLAFDISQRTHEIGVRSALGASRQGIVGMVMRQALGLTAVGLAIGLVVAVLTSGSLEPVLYEESPRDPLVFAGVAITLLLVAAAAAIIPAARAARVDPVTALRTE